VKVKVISVFLRNKCNTEFQNLKKNGVKKYNSVFSFRAVFSGLTEKRKFMKRSHEFLDFTYFKTQVLRIRLKNVL